MNGPAWRMGLIVLSGLLAGAAFCIPFGWAQTPAPPAKPAAATPEIWGLDRLWNLHLEISPDEYKAMQAKAPPLFPALVPKPAQPPDSDRNVFGTEFPWVVGDFTADGVRFGPVGMRYKGNSTYMAAAPFLKRSIKIELDHYDDDYRFYGLKTLNLNCSVLDPSRIREAMAYSVMRAAGYPAPRTAFAEVTLTVPGKHDKALLGLYTLIEQVDKGYLKNRFDSSKGVLLKPERMRGLDYRGEDWARYVRDYQPRSEPTPEQAKRIIDFIRLVSKGTPEQFEKEIADYLDMDAFLRFLGTNAMVSALDTFFALGHNYYLYLNPKTNRFVFLPWDLDLAMGNFAMMASTEQQFDLSLKHPYAGTSRLTERVLALPGMEEKYLGMVKEMAAKAFTREKLYQSLDLIEKTTRDALAREVKASAARREPPPMGPGGPLFGKAPEIRTFIDRRVASVENQLAGKSTGLVPAFGFPFGGGPNVEKKPEVKPEAKP